MQILGSLLFYARTIDSPIIILLGAIASEQLNGTEATQKASQKPLNYCATFLNAKLYYQESQIPLHTHGGASYISAPKLIIQVIFHFYLGKKTNYPNTNMHNGGIFVISGILKTFMSSVAEAEFGGLFANTREVKLICATPEELRHKQFPTPIITYNSKESGIVNNTIKKHHS